jgi:hypothetical protein
MNWGEVKYIFQQLQESPRNDATFSGLREALIASAVSYARAWTDWQLASVERRREIDPRRTASHTALIDACNILSRHMSRHGHDIGWRARLGDDRNAIGDFACYVHCMLGLAAR